MIAVAAAGLCRRYGRRWALADVSFEVPAGALAMVTVRNGSGKSTLLRVLATAIRPDLGTARILGHDVRAERELVRHRVGLLGHRTHLYEPLTALENLAVVARFLGADAGRRALLGIRAEKPGEDRKSTRLNSSHVAISYAVFCLKKKNRKNIDPQSKTTSGSS